MSSLNLVSRVVAAFLVATTLLGCGSGDSAYFPTEGTTSKSIPMTAQEPAWFGIERLSAQEGDRVRLEGIEVIGPHGNPTVAGLATVLNGRTVAIGASTESGIPKDQIDLATYKPIEGFEFGASDGPVALAVRVTGTEPVLGFDSVRLRFRINGGSEQTELFRVKGYACTGVSIDAAQQACHPFVGDDG